MQWIDFFFVYGHQRGIVRVSHRRQRRAGGQIVVIHLDQIATYMHLVTLEKSVFVNFSQLDPVATPSAGTIVTVTDTRRSGASCRAMATADAEHATHAIDRVECSILVDYECLKIWQSVRHRHRRHVVE